ncbi:hypothetical protein MNBD_GAMMA15-2389 [hydrothermal vent metagenome]|uniref:Thioredoxin domain-containing protein n=1 Tax=hydrothermal vent metagenome TaxID=652676 RepID=A0A3B0YHS5_9ZZZZ
MHHWIKRTVAYGLITLAVLPLLESYSGTATLATNTDFPLPEFIHQQPEAWINSEPLSVNALKGKVILVDVWTFGCWNCYRSFPWLNDLEARYENQGLQVIGIHTPEFDREKIRSNIIDKVREFALKHPVMIDNDFSYWRALNNRYWPSYYLVDRQGTVRFHFVGEMHINTAKARVVDQEIERLLAGTISKP